MEKVLPGFFRKSVIFAGMKRAVIPFRLTLLNQWAARYRPFVRINHIIFWWYYRRVPEFYRQWTILKSIAVLSGALKQIEKEWQSEAKRADKYFSQIVEIERQQV